MMNFNRQIMFFGYCFFVSVVPLDAIIVVGLAWDITG